MSNDISNGAPPESHREYPMLKNNWLPPDLEPCSEFPEKDVSKLSIIFPAENDEKHSESLPKAVKSPRISHRQSSAGLSDIKSNWSSIYVASIIMFLNGIQFSLRLTSLWPFLQQIDSTARPSFFGWVVATFSLAQLISSIVLGFTSNAIRTTRVLIAVGVSFLFMGNILFCFVEEFRQDLRRWILMLARVIMGIGAGTSSILRASIAQSCVPKDKTRAINMGAGAFAFGVIIGPGVQAAFTPIGYPGYVRGSFHFDMYTTPGYFAALVNLIMFFVAIFLFKDKFVGVSNEHAKFKNNKFVKLPRYDHLAAFFCVLIWFMMLFGYTNLETIGTPFTMAMFDWTKQQTVLFNGIVQAISGVISFLIFVVLGIVFPNKIPVRPTLLAGMSLLMCFYIITFPWPGLPHMPDYKYVLYTGNATFPNDTRNDISPPALEATTQFLLTAPNHTQSAARLTTTTSHVPVGCESYYKWCRYTTKVEESQYFVGMFLSALCFPLTNVVLSPLFSQIIGPRRQERMQGMFVGSGSCARFVGPIFISRMFDMYGPRVPWGVIIGMALIMIVSTLLLYKRLKPLEISPKLKSGENFRYKNGILYHF